MRRAASVIAAGLAFAAAAAPALAQRPALSPLPRDAQRPDVQQFAVAAEQDPVRRLVLCDVIRFTLSRPNLNAQRMSVRRDNYRYDLLLPPYFVQGGNWFDEDYERAYRRLRDQPGAGVQKVADVQAEVGPPLIRNFYRVGGPERRFLEEQDNACQAEVRARWRR